MGGDATERLRWKEPLHSLEVELQQDYGLTPVSSRALVRRLGEFLEASIGDQQGSRQSGQVTYPAVAVGERAGKPLKYCLTVPVSLTVLHAADAEVLHEQGSPALRRTRLARLCAEARSQGAALSHEDLSLLLGVEGSTIRRMVRDCAEQGQRPPTRGLVDDIGPTVSHKEQVVRLYFGGLLPQHIAARTGHSLGSVERYLTDFARVVHLRRQGLEPQVAGRILGMSQALLRRYLSLADRFDGVESDHVIERLLRRFGPFEEEVSHG